MHKSHVAVGIADGHQNSIHRRSLHADKDEAARRSSAPEAPQHRRTQQDPSKLRPVNSDHQSLSSQQLTEPIRAAAARAALLPETVTPGLSEFSVTSGSDRSSLDSIEDLKPADRQALGIPRAPHYQTPQHHSHGTQLDRHKPLRYGSIQHNLLTPYESRAASGHSTATASSRGGLIALPENASANFGSSSEDSNRSNATHVGSISNQGPSQASDTSVAEGGRNIRPSMEARRRRLGSSALQVHLGMLVPCGFVVGFFSYLYVFPFVFALFPFPACHDGHVTHDSAFNFAPLACPDFDSMAMCIAVLSPAACSHLQFIQASLPHFRSNKSCPLQT